MLQLDVLNFKIGETTISISNNLIQSCPYDNIFRDIITSIQEMGHSLDTTQRYSLTEITRILFTF
jgi:hypothetical protein